MQNYFTTNNCDKKIIMVIDIQKFPDLQYFLYSLHACILYIGSAFTIDIIIGDVVTLKVTIFAGTNV